MGDDLETEHMHRLESSSSLDRTFVLGVIITALLSTGFLVALCWDAANENWTVGIGTATLVWAATFWTEYGFKAAAERRERDYLEDLMTRVSEEMITAFSRGRPETSKWVEEYGLSGAFGHILKSGIALHVKSATHSGGPRAALGRWRSIGNTLEHARQSLHGFLSAEQQHQLAKLLFVLETTPSQIQVARERPWGDLSSFQAKVQNELQGVTVAFHQIVIRWLRLWQQSVPEESEFSPIGASALEKTKAIVDKPEGRYYYLWRDHGFDVDLDEETEAG